MKIGIIVYSQRGNTEKVAQKLKEKLTTAGHKVTVESIVTEGKINPGVKNIKFKVIPKTDPYEGIVFASPVMAFSLCPVMKEYLNQITTLKNKKVAFLAAKKLPFIWTGGSQAIAWMNKACKNKEANILGSGVMIWSSKNLEQKKAELIESIAALF
ncbi:MAG: NAD(P)H-dependent oxidoreductase [Spirochaetales bacterium]|nr:NAD(P)H-dependent oxidoreductase [Spirochaetales bacterium]